LNLTTTKSLSFILNIDGPQVVACHMKYHLEKYAETTSTTRFTVDSDLIDGFYFHHILYYLCLMRIILSIFLFIFVE